MGDTKEGRDKQGRDEERRQRERELDEARERADEAEPPRDEQNERVHDGELGDLDAALEERDYPTTTDELIQAYGDRVVESRRGWKSIEDVLTPVGDETYNSADEVRNRILRLLSRE